ncbi:DNA internalization-related competence protein ComEC/Rec2 [Lachnospiraceae bacterium JLR.KK008]
MRRYTLCKLCFCMIGLLSLMQWAGQPPGALVPEIPGGTATVFGTVAQIEEKENAYHQKQVILSLQSAAFCGVTIPDKQNQITASNQTERTEIGGVLCFMAEGEEMPLIGQRIVVSGQPQMFEGRRNPGGFDALSWYRAQGLTISLKKARIEGRGEQYDFFRQKLHECRQGMARILDAVCGEDGGVMRAMLLGDKTALSAERKNLYQQGGISHILAISGLHISFLGMGLYGILKKTGVPVGIAVFIASVFLFSYVTMTGSSPSSCRAAMMIAFCLAADLLGRSYERMTALSVSALLLVARQPLLLGQSGFLLSYGAITGLELVCPILTGLWENRIARIFFAGASIFFVTLPVMLTSFYEIPVYSFFLNLYVIPLMGVVIALGLLSLLAGLFSIPLARAIFYPVHLLLILFDGGCRLTGSLPGDLWVMGAPSVMQIVIYCMMLATFCMMKKYMTKPCALLLLAGAVWVIKAPLPSADTMTMLDVGQGDGIVIQSSDGTTMLIDGGSSSEKELAQYTLLPYLKSQGIRRLDYVFLSHMDADHTNGIEALIQGEAAEEEEAQAGPGEGDHKRQIEIGTLVLPPLSQRDEAYDRVVSAARRAGIRLCTIKAGDQMEIGGFRFLCLHPEEGGSYSDRNEASLVLYVRKGNFSALFMGDLDGEAEAAFVRSYQDSLGAVTVLKAGHHGSGASCGEELLSSCRPAITLISCSMDNSYGHPAPETLARIVSAGSKVYITKDTGAICIRIGKRRVQVRRMLADADRRGKSD